MTQAIKTYLVGGAVRDRLLGLAVKDRIGWSSTPLPNGY